MPVYGRNLILIIGGGMKPGEKIKGYLRRVANDTGIGFRSIEEVWKGRYQSKKTERQLQTAAQRKVRTNDDERIKWLESHIAHLEAVDRSFFSQDINAAREFLARYRGYAETRVFASVPDGNVDDQEGD